MKLTGKATVLLSVWVVLYTLPVGILFSHLPAYCPAITVVFSHLSANCPTVSQSIVFPPYLPISHCCCMPIVQLSLWQINWSVFINILGIYTVPLKANFFWHCTSKLKFPKLSTIRSTGSFYKACHSVQYKQWKENKRDHKSRILV